MRIASRVVLGFCAGFLTLTNAPDVTADSRIVVAVAPDRSSINPSLGESVRIAVEVGGAGSADIEVIDRDGYLVRTLAQHAEVTTGSNTFSWDGRDERGSIVPDEAYSFRIRWTDGRSHETYFPADEPAYPCKSVGGGW